ncbi:uncharacterized protein N7482_008364 [Penicillium canariense]|uniref:Major facilitator superfamily (MFS) profile domain-containing protein n=1 Tax=Penicillium canariense TaxID=189055 RepID=A0A9W9HYA6_9EURO|nr:uncharacterized protein N7482_008364 [Penicillium canariense]KAJ5157264.1 hypothetical protein N7482_008364 [Penicillium canariense]
MSSDPAPTVDTITSVGPTDVELVVIPSHACKQDDPFLAAFAEPFDAENPKHWRTGRKWAVTDVLSATGFNRIMVSTIMAPALSTIAREFDMNSAESAMTLSIYLLATAFGPLVIGPLSEASERVPSMHWQAVFWERPEQRGRSLGVYLLIPLLGAAVGPIIGGFMADRTTWRWMFWSTSIFQAVMILVSFTAFHETYEPLILRHRAGRIRHETGDSRYYTTDERLHANKSATRILGRALVRPLRLLTLHPIIQIASLISAFNYGILHIVLSTFSDL